MENISFELINHKYFCGKEASLCFPHQVLGRDYPCSVFVQVEEGSYFVQLDNIWYEISEGQAAFIPSHITHGIKMINEGTLNWAHIQYSIFNSLDLFSLYHTPLIIDGNDAKRIGECCRQLAALNNTNQKKPIDKITKIVELKYFFTELMYIIIQNSTPNAKRIEDLRKLETVYPLLNYIATNIFKKIAAEEMASVLNLSVPRLYIIFKRATGFTPMEYVINEKLKKSCQLLLYENKSVTEIAWELGYEDPLYFSKCFKRKYGISPSEYKNAFISHNP